MKGILADIHAGAHIDYLVRMMQADPWSEIWKDLRLALRHFDDVGLERTSSDLEIWQKCQEEQLVLITNNRNDDGPDSLESTIRNHNSTQSLPVFTIGDFNRFRNSQAYAVRVLEKLYEYLLDIDRVRGTGRLYLP